MYFENKRLKYTNKDWSAYLNFLEAIEDRNKQVKNLKKYPFALYVDPASLCNLQCPFCPTGKRINARKPETLPLNIFKKLIDEVGNYVFHIDFYNWGEPLLNRDLIEMLNYVKKFSITSEISTNLSVPLNYEKAVELMNSGIDRMIISVDGASQEAYQKYRVGGNLELVFKNMKLLSDAKKEARNNKTVLLWRFFVFKHNQHEIDKAKSIAKELGVDVVFERPYVEVEKFDEWASTMEDFRPLNSPPLADQVHLPQTEEKTKMEERIIPNSKLTLPPSCDWLWFMPVINGNGNISPCCVTTYDKEDFGSIKEEHLTSVLNNKKFINARKLASGEKIEPNLNLICEQCPAKGIWHYSDETMSLIFESLLSKLGQKYQLGALTFGNMDWNIFQKLKEIVIAEINGIKHDKYYVEKTLYPLIIESRKIKQNKIQKIISLLKSKNSRSSDMLLSYENRLDKIYNEMLGRSADKSGLDYFLPRLVQKELTEKDIREIILNSEEYKGRAGISAPKEQ